MIRKIQISGLYSFGNGLQTIDFTAKPKIKLANTKYEYNFNIDERGRPMKSAIFFGQNASGKTNLFLSIKILLNIIRNGLNQFYSNVAFDDVLNKDSKQIQLGIEVSDGNKIFEYFICFDQNQLKTEKFLVNGKELYIYDDEKAKFRFKEFGSSDTIGDTIDNQLGKLLSRKLSESIFVTIRDFDFEMRTKFFNIISKIDIYMTSSFSKEYVVEFKKDKKDYFLDNKNNLLKIVQIIDKTIDDFDFEEIQKGDDSEYRICFYRNKIRFDYKEESEGLKKIWQLIDSLYNVIRQGRVLIVDELDSSISTKALIEIFNEFVNSSENKKGQLIVTSHNVLLFDITFLHSQQIFLVEKNRELYTTIKTYYDYDIKSNRKYAYVDYLKRSFDE